MKTIMQQLETPLTNQSANMAKAGISYGSSTGQVASRGRLLSVVLILLSAGIVATLLPTAMAAETVSGEQFEPGDARFHRLVASCLDCHAIDDDSAGYVGPTLKGIVGRRVAGINSYSYSAALYKKAAAGLIWGESSLDRFLEAPQTMAPGIAMKYAGVPDPDNRARLIAWLATGPEPLSIEVPVAAALPHAPEVEAVLQIKADIEYGEYLAGKCLTCHSAPGASGSVPPIVGLPADYFINALLEYQQGERSSRVMLTMSLPLEAEELAALAAFFSQPAL
ncbi:MAG: hypothetical protein V3U76_07110 [Granulosicoccus sp.]